MHRNHPDIKKRLIIGSGQTDTFLWKDDCNLRIDAILEEGGRSRIFVLNEGHDTEISVTQASPGSASSINILNLSRRKNAISVSVDLGGNGCTSEVTILTLLSEGSDTSVDSKLLIRETSSGSRGEIRQRAIVVGEGGVISGAPRLRICTGESDGRHSFSMEKLDPDRVHYLTARGIPEHMAKRLLLQGIVDAIFSAIGFDSERYLDTIITR